MGWKQSCNSATRRAATSFSFSDFRFCFSQDGKGTNPPYPKGELFTTERKGGTEKKLNNLGALCVLYGYIFLTWFISPGIIPIMPKKVGIF